MKTREFQQTLPLPPYGRVIEAYLLEGIRKNFPIYIYVGKTAKQVCYAQKCMGTVCCYLPFGQDYQNFRWPIENQKIVVLDTGYSSAINLKRMCFKLLHQYKPQIIYLYSDSFPHEIFKQGELS